jgi:hypothetical protein
MARGAVEPALLEAHAWGVLGTNGVVGAECRRSQRLRKVVLKMTRLLHQTTECAVRIRAGGVEQNAEPSTGDIRVDPLAQRAGRISAAHGKRLDQQVRKCVEEHVGTAREESLALVLLGPALVPLVKAIDSVLHFGTRQPPVDGVRAELNKDPFPTVLDCWKPGRLDGDLRSLNVGLIFAVDVGHHGLEPREPDERQHFTEAMKLSHSFNAFRTSCATPHSIRQATGMEVWVDRHIVSEVRHTLGEFVSEAFIDLPNEEVAQAGDYPATPIWNNGAQEPGLTADNANELGGDVDDTPPHYEFAAEADIDVERALGSGLGDHVSRAAMVKGVDGLAWYVSFHARGPQWGIYLPVSSIVGVAGTVFGATTLDLSAKMRLAAHVMHQHELFHFAVDYMTALWELTHQQPCWKPGRNLRRTSGYYELEEQLANAHMLRRINAVTRGMQVRGRADALRGFIKQQPAGYRDAPKVVKSEIFRRECVRLCVEYIEEWNGGRVPKEVFRPVLTELLLVDRRLDWRNCPVHIVQDGTRFSLPDLAAALFASVPFVYEPEDFVRQLGTCDVTIRKAWERTKRKLAQTVRAQGLDFKLWERRGDSKEFSVRIDRNFRAHLLFEPSRNTWTAVRIGPHTAMGHD